MAQGDLTDRSIAALRRKPAKPGKTYDVMDRAVRGFGVRVNERGVLTYFLNTRPRAVPTHGGGKSGATVRKRWPRPAR